MLRLADIGNRRTREAETQRSGTVTATTKNQSPTKAGLTNLQEVRTSRITKEWGDELNRTFGTFFAVLLSAQWLIGIAIALFYSPLAWSGSQSSVHSHVWAAVLLGGLFALPAAAMGRFRSTHQATPYAIAAAQMLTGALWIHLGGGRIEMHFHVFVSLALLALFTNWKVVVLAAGVAAVDHVARSFIWPQSIFGMEQVHIFRWVEHALWVVAETGALVFFCVRTRRQTREAAGHAASVEIKSEQLDEAVRQLDIELGEIQRTGDLRRGLTRPADPTLATLTDSVAGFVRTLADVISQVSKSALNVTGMTTNMVAASEQTSASIEQIARDADETRKAAEDAGRNAEESGGVIQTTIDGMRSLGGLISDASGSVNDLDERSKRIAEIVRVIGDIADQTNLLALNAAIEAARAGEHGRGFAVVADEVRKLADRTAQSTDEVSGAITAMSEMVRKSLESMQHCTAAAEEGASSAETGQRSLQTILAGSRTVENRVRQISAATNEAGQAAASTSHTCAELLTSAKELESMVQRFKV